MLVICSGYNSAQGNMDKDSRLLSELSVTQSPTLHFYDWEQPSASYGYFLQPFDHLVSEGVEQCKLQLAKRPTGGGIIFHLWDFTFSFLLPANHSNFSLNTLENYQFVNQIILKALERFLENSDITLTETDFAELSTASKYFCMAKPTKYDLIVEGKKIGGAAQRRTKAGFLHQGSISLQAPDSDFLRKVLPKDTGLVSAMETFSYPLLNKQLGSSDLGKLKQVLRQFIEEEFRNRLTNH